MSRPLNRLSALAVERTKTPGMYADGGGLYLQIKAAGARSWIFRYRTAGRRSARDMGLGSVATVSLARARQKAAEMRTLLDEGKDPLQHRQQALADEARAAASAVSFETCAEAYIAAHKACWRNAKHRWQWGASLKAYAYPVLGELPASQIDAALVLRVLEPIWQTKTETATRLRGRIEVVLDYAKAHGYRQGENPARWRGNLDHLLPTISKASRVTHLAALPFAQVGEFMTRLRQRSGTAARALEFAILTAARTGEVIGARWTEIDFHQRVWTVPAERMKTAKEHRVPLSTAAIAVLQTQAEIREGDFVFPSQRPEKAVSNMALLRVLQRMKRVDLTVHGFRSTFRDWASEQTSHPHEVAEMALAHQIANKVEAAYRRGDLLQKRAVLMEDWAQYCAVIHQSAEVILLRSISQ